MLKMHSLSHSALHAWRDFEAKVRHSRNHASPKNIHALRISTQKLEAVLTLAGGFLKGHRTKKMIHEIRAFRKSFGALRDIHVEEKALKSGEFDITKFGQGRDFVSYCGSLKARATKKAGRKLKNVSLHHERRKFFRIVSKLRRIEKCKEAALTQKKLGNTLLLSVAKLNDKLSALNPDNTKKIHRFRTQAKKLRYQGECMHTLTGISYVDLGKLKRIQSIAGRIQNDRVFLKTLVRFSAKKKYADDAQSMSIRKQLELSQEKLKSEFFTLSRSQK